MDVCGWAMQCVVVVVDLQLGGRRGVVAQTCHSMPCPSQGRPSKFEFGAVSDAAVVRRFVFRQTVPFPSLSLHLLVASRLLMMMIGGGGVRLPWS